MTIKGTRPTVQEPASAGSASQANRWFALGLCALFGGAILTRCCYRCSRSSGLGCLRTRASRRSRSDSAGQHRHHSCPQPIRCEPAEGGKKAQRALWGGGGAADSLTGEERMADRSRAEQAWRHSQMVVASCGRRTGARRGFCRLHALPGVCQRVLAAGVGD